MTRGFAQKLFPRGAVSSSSSPRSGGLNLARPFKAGISASATRVVALATAETFIQSSLTRRNPTCLFDPALARPGQTQPSLRRRTRTG